MIVPLVIYHIYILLLDILLIQRDFLLLLILLTTGCVCSLAKGRDFELPAMVELGMLADLTGLVSTLPTLAEVALLCAMLGNSPSLMGMLCTRC